MKEMAADEQAGSCRFGAVDEILDPAVTNIVLRDRFLEHEAMAVRRRAAGSKKFSKISKRIFDERFLTGRCQFWCARAAEIRC